MDTNSSLYGGFGENFLEDFMSADVDESTSAQTNNAPFGEGVDILQQSLKAADILDGDRDSGEISFDDLGFTFNNDSYTNTTNSALSPYQFHNPNQSAASGSYLSDKPSADGIASPFDAAEFLNEGSSGDTLSVQTQSNHQHFQENNIFDSFQLSPNPQPTSHLNKPQKLVTYKENVSFTANAPLRLSQQAANKPQNLQNYSSQPQLNTISVISNNSTAQQRVGNLQVTLAGSPSVLVRQGISQSPNVAHSYQNTQYIVSGNQSLPQYSNTSYTVCTGTTLQSNSVTTCGSTFSRVPNQTVSAPIVLTVNPQVNQAVLRQAPATVNTLTMQQIQQQQFTPNASIVTQRPNEESLATKEEQTNKLALLLQSKAVQQTGSGNAAILRVGSQSINISDPAIAKALASKILEQRMKQQARSQSQQPVSSIQQIAPSSINQNHAVQNVRDIQNKPVIANNASHLQLQGPVKTQYVIKSVPQNIITQNSLNQQLVARPVVQQPFLQSNINNSKASPIAQLSMTKSSSPVPINRIQIASVNIPLTVHQSSNALPTQRSSTPIQIIQQNSAVKPPSNTIVVGNLAQSNLPSTTPTTSSAPSTLVQQLGTSLKLNLTSRQTNNLSREQVQRLHIQHQAAVRARRTNVPISTEKSAIVAQPIAVASIVQPKLTQNAENMQPKTITASSTKVVTFKVEPNLTMAQVEQVQQIILQKLPYSKIAQLTKEQKQLLAAFRAQLRAMEAPVQQYYLRNPQFFLQKVYQHLQTGKPFILQAKIENLNTGKNIATTTTTNAATKFHHPTISLGPDSQRNKFQTVKINRLIKSTQNQRNSVKRSADDERSSASASPAHSPIKRPSLIIEQLQQHREIAESPNITSPFKTVRAACRRLLPYHVYNMPQIKDNFFDESEPLYDKISDCLTTKMTKMLTKYHMLCLKDASRESCSSDDVMLERSFLQNERAMLAELKQKLKDEPNAIISYLPHETHQDNPNLATYLDEQMAPNRQLQLEDSPSSYLNERKISQQSSESFDCNSSYSSKTYYNNQAHEPGESDILPVESQSEILLQEAVESILS